jgi:hypothetical protein
MLSCQEKFESDIIMHHTKNVDKQGQGEASSLNDVSSSTKTTSSPGRAARRVSMKFKKGLKEVKEMLSPHHHHHHHHRQDDHSPDGHRRRRSGPYESRRGPLAPVLDHLEKNNSVPIHLHISRDGSFSVSRKGSSSSYSCSDIAHDESKTLDDIRQHIQQSEEQREDQREEPTPTQGQPQPQPQPQLEPSPSPPLLLPEPEPEPEPEQPTVTVESEQSEDQQQPAPQPEMEVPEPFVDPPSPQHSGDDDDGGDERTPNPFLVDDPEDPLSDPGSPVLAPVSPQEPVSSPLEIPPSDPVSLSPGPAMSELSLAAEPVLTSPPAVDKPVPALPISSDTESETTETPAVHLPQLVMPTMFLPIPNVRISSHLTWWLTRRTPIYY